MRIIRTCVITAFIIAIIVFGVAEFREFKSKDSSAPELISDREVLEIPCEYTEEELLEGLSAYDDRDGDLSSQILVGNLSRFIEKGVSNVSYIVFDSSKQPATLTRKVKFTDYHSPRFTLSQPLVYLAEEGDYAETMNRIGATDQLEGDLKSVIRMKDTDVKYQSAGTYQITVEVENKYGDSSSVSLPVHIIDLASHPLEIRLTEPIVYLSVGEEFNPNAYVTGVFDRAGNGIGVPYVIPESYVDNQTPGTYEVYYHVVDAAGNAGETWMTVVVQE